MNEEFAGEKTEQNRSNLRRQERKPKSPSIWTRSAWNFVRWMLKEVGRPDCVLTNDGINGFRTTGVMPSAGCGPFTKEKLSGLLGPCWVPSRFFGTYSAASLGSSMTSARASSTKP